MLRRAFLQSLSYCGILPLLPVLAKDYDAEMAKVCEVKPYDPGNPFRDFKIEVYSIWGNKVVYRNPGVHHAIWDKFNARIQFNPIFITGSDTLKGCILRRPNGRRYQKTDWPQGTVPVCNGDILNVNFTFTSGEPIDINNVANIKHPLFDLGISTDADLFAYRRRFVDIPDNVGFYPPDLSAEIINQWTPKNSRTA
jgi:hypothetical protein